jgi:biopolymer transport protein ExbD
MKWELEDNDDEPDLTPMIDIVFLLIVFFMTVANVVTAQKKPIEVPIAENARVPETQENREVITVVPDGQIFLGTIKVSLEELQAIVAEGLRTTPNYQVLLRVDSATPFIHTRDVMTTCAEVGAIDIIFATYQGNK